MLSSIIASPSLIVELAVDILLIPRSVNERLTGDIVLNPRYEELRGVFFGDRSKMIWGG
jgi:hypothetical protein